MIANEFMMLVGVISAGLIFFLAAQTHLMSTTEETVGYSIKAVAERISSITERLSTESSYARYCMNISLSNVKVEEGYMTFTQRGKTYRVPVSKNVKNVDLKEVAHLCFVHNSDGSIEIFGEPIVCDMNILCDPSECGHCCPDCSPPDCIGDGKCEKCIGENCENSIDCLCNGTCCPPDPTSDNYGCVNESRLNLSKGEECFCDNECNSSANLTCNPTSPNFTDFNKACCEPGKMWNGSACEIAYCKYPCTPRCKLPDKWDWRNVDGTNWLNPVRDQGACGSCWAFSAAGCVEGTYNVENNCPACNEDLSEQQLVSNNNPCCGLCGDCGGGWPHSALGYIKNTGIVDENCFSYTAATISCSLCSNYTSRLRKITTFGSVSNKLDDIKRAVICKGPLSIASMSWRHAIVLVGYDDNKKEWIIRNSWGSGWGYGGYGYIPYSGHRYSDLKNYVYYAEGVK